MKLNELQTMRRVYEDICQKEQPWVALGNFMNYWYKYAEDQREALICEPLPAHDPQQRYQHRWAVFCAATVEWFCATYDLPCPSWVHDPIYQLKRPWFFQTHAEARVLLRHTTPTFFRRRNIYCGDRCFENKWEWVAQQKQRVSG